MVGAKVQVVPERDLEDISRGRDVPVVIVVSDALIFLGEVVLSGARIIAEIPGCRRTTGHGKHIDGRGPIVHLARHIVEPSSLVVCLSAVHVRMLAEDDAHTGAHVQR